MTTSSNQPASMNLKTLETGPAGIENPETSSTRSQSPSTVTSSPTAKERRSVSSMRGLMPLALLPSSSSSWTSRQSVTSDNGAVDRLDECLPELLARDLEMSADVFASKDMTAASPNTGFLSDERSQARASSMPMYSPYLAASARVQVLGAIQERDSMISFIKQDDDPAMNEHHSDSASMISQDSSEEAEPPSFRHRGSVVTTATSVGSMRGKAKISPPPERTCGCSWFDVYLDREERDDETRDELNAGPLSPRPPTPPGHDIRAAVSSFGAQPSHVLRRKSRSDNGDVTIPTSPRQPIRSSLNMIHHRSSSVPSSQPQPSMSCGGSSLSPPFGNRPCRDSKKLGRTQPLCVNTVATSFPTARPLNLAGEPHQLRDLSPMSDEVVESDDETMCSPLQKRPSKENSVSVGPPSPSQPMRTVQSWLNSTLQPYSWVSQSEDNARVVPLPPDALENLRVSVACFPETLLLTSSLTVETIRSYGKKVRQLSLGSSQSTMTGITSVPEPPRRPLWRKVIPHRRGSQPPEAVTFSRPCSSRHDHGSAPTSSAYTDPSKPWIPLRNVFGSCSDYICDALYAHIVAYNYVSALVVRSPSRPSGPGRFSTANTRDPHPRDDIPKKAASLLGLSSGGDDRAASMARLPQRRLGSSLGDWSHREGMVTQRDTTAATAQDGALRAIQTGLLRCISRLVSTAKLMAENGAGEERMVDMETEEADMLFMRSLCEIVRVAEEAS
ncbi:hypothetical protein E4U41_006302 [Claviceps citrina]|nr:hypothetical protein E4U41_006302 [Claviceps citrina]